MDGLILSPKLTGDTAEWIEIAQYGDEYSLIVRAEFINHNTEANRYNNPEFQYAPFDEVNYVDSMANRIVNKWFNNVAPGESDAVDNLDGDARLRQFTMANTAMSNLGTASVLAGMDNGYSTPETTNLSDGDGVAFILSYSEAANFSITHFIRENAELANQLSNSMAESNFIKSNYLNIRPPRYL